MNSLSKIRRAVFLLFRRCRHNINKIYEMMPFWFNSVCKLIENV